VLSQDKKGWEPFHASRFDIQKIHAFLGDRVITFWVGKLPSIHPFSFFTLNFIAIWPTSMPRVICTRGFSLFPWLSTTGLCWPGVHHRWPTREESAQKGVVCQKSWKICFLRESHAIMQLMREFGSMNRNLWGIFPGQRGPKIHFWTEADKAAALSQRRIAPEGGWRG
jgi:hypothetical protein